MTNKIQLTIEDGKAVAQWFRDRRLAKKIRVEELATLLQVDKNTIYRYESSDKYPRYLPSTAVHNQLLEFYGYRLKPLVVPIGVEFVLQNFLEAIK